METPFIFGKLASGDYFTNRTEEIIHLKNNFKSGINTIMISPRRLGKSSLVHKDSCAIMEENKKIKIISIVLHLRTKAVGKDLFPAGYPGSFPSCPAGDCFIPYSQSLSERP